MNQKIKIGLLIFLFVASFLFLFMVIYDKLIGDYIIDSYWIGNDSNGVKYCNNCLWIRFDEGCNRYKTFYFENQHELDKRLEVGMSVDIFFTKQGTIRNVEPRLAYSYCSRRYIEFFKSKNRSGNLK